MNKKFILIFFFFFCLGIFLAPIISPQKAHAQTACSIVPVSSNTATSSVNVSQTGTYTIWSSILAPSTTNNSYYLVIDGGCPIDVGGGSAIPTNTWTWINYQNGDTAAPINVSLSQGTHTIKLIQNQSGVGVAKIIFTQDTTCVPTGTGDNCLPASSPAVSMTPTLTPTQTPSSSQSATINVTPTNSSLTVGSPINVTVSVNGGGQTFNAASATVSVSSNLTVNSLTTGNCNFYYTQTPTTQNPSFAGGILNASSTACTVYTLNVTPNAAGTGTITVSSGSVKAYTNSSEILSGVTNGSYTLTSSPTVTPSQTSTPQPSVSGTNSLQIYTDALASGWLNWTSTNKSTFNFSNTSPVYSGKYSIAFAAIQPYGDIFLHTNTAVNTAPYNYIHFMARGAVAGHQYMLKLYGPNGRLTNSNILISNYGGSISSTQWVSYNIPLSVLNAANTSITSINLAEAQGTTAPTLYVDDIALAAQQISGKIGSSGGTSSPTPTIAPTSTTHIYSVSPQPTVYVPAIQTPTNTPAPIPTVGTSNPSPTATTLSRPTFGAIYATYDASYILKGSRDSNEGSIFINGSEKDTSYPNSTSWQATVPLSIGANSITVYGQDSKGAKSSSNVTTIQRHRLGDINGDGMINLTDVSLFANDWNKCGSKMSDSLSDMSGDGCADLTSFSILARQFGK